MIRDERGGGTVLVAGVAFSLLCVTTVVVVLIGWFSVVRQAERVAEIAALAGASSAVEGTDPCDGARAAARQNGMAVSRCVVRGSSPDVVVEVGVEAQLTPSPGGSPMTIERRATAGTM